VQQFADDCLSAEQLSGDIAAQLLTALCSQHPGLQAAAVAAHVSNDAAAQNSTDAPQDRLPDIRDDIQQLVQLLAALCYSQTTTTTSSSSSNSNSSGSIDFDALEASYAEWASALSSEAAAAALSAAWLHRGHSPSSSGPAVAMLCLELYQRARGSGDSLVFELGLLAAAEAAKHTGNWHRGRCLWQISQGMCFCITSLHCSNKNVGQMPTMCSLRPPTTA
jgi:hypothetical protein